MLCLVTQSSPTLCNPMDCSPTGSSVHRILQARILEWVAVVFSIKPRSPALQADSLPSEPSGKPKFNDNSWLLHKIVIMITCVQPKSLHISNFVRPYGLQPARLLCPWDSLGKILKWVPCPPPGDFLDPGIKPESLKPACLGNGSFSTSATWKAQIMITANAPEKSVCRSRSNS